MNTAQSVSSITRAKPEPPPGWPEKMQRTARFVYGSISSLDPRVAQPDYLANAKLFRRSSVRTIEESAGKPIDTTASWFVGNQVGFFRIVCNSCVEGKRTVEDAKADGYDGIVVDYVMSGQYTEMTEHGRIVLNAGDLGMVQSTIPVTARSRKPSLATIFLPRPRIVEALGADLAEDRFPVLKLSSAPLKPFVAAQMALLYDLYGKISPYDFETALDVTAELLLHLLRGELARSPRPEAQHSEQFAEAIAYIDKHFHNARLVPEDIGRAIGASRARLYKLFADNGLTVAGYLRDLRLRRFADALRTADESGIGQLAWQCGFDMQPADFARLFKRLYGMTPGQARLALRDGASISLKTSNK